MTIHFRIPAVPVAQPRPRATAINGQARMYEAKKDHAIHSFKAACKLAANQAYQGAPLEAPLRVAMIFVFPRPKGMRWKTKPMPRVPHTKKPDVDNLAKSVLDGLNGLLFVDDSQAYDVTCLKFIASGDEQSHVEIRIDAT
jgi:Holliday junction resolvase RusA-like endonuclease